MTAEDWTRVANFVRDRRHARGLRQEDTEDVSAATWRKLEKAQATSYKDRTLANVERALRWPPGTLRHIAQGGEPPPDDVTTAARLDALEAEVQTVNRRLQELTSLVQRMGRTGGAR